MNTPAEELFTLAGRLDSITKQAGDKNIEKPLSRLREAAEAVGRSWSGSWIGYHSTVYYEGFEPPPSGAHFSPEWGLQQTRSDRGSVGEWQEYAFEDVVNAIQKMAGKPDLTRAQALAAEADSVFEEIRGECLSIIATSLGGRDDHYLRDLKEKIEKLKALTSSDVIAYQQPKGTLTTRDRLALSQRFKCPPHITMEANVFGIQQRLESCSDLAKLVRQAAAHMSRQGRSRQSKEPGTKVFIGHGRSLLWRSLKDFVNDRLGLPWDEFNRVPIAGVTNIQRLSEMLDSAAVAFLVMTAEDEQKDGKFQARMNVVHEAGLFQGRLGFTKAIVILEEGCEEFSNIAGLGQIRFPAGKIESAFEQVRQVLEREGVV